MELLKINEVLRVWLFCIKNPTAVCHCNHLMRTFLGSLFHKKADNKHNNSPLGHESLRRPAAAICSNCSNCLCVCVSSCEQKRVCKSNLFLLQKYLKVHEKYFEKNGQFTSCRRMFWNRLRKCFLGVPLNVERTYSHEEKVRYLNISEGRCRKAEACVRHVILVMTWKRACDVIPQLIFYGNKQNEWPALNH